MNFVADESVEKPIVDQLRADGHDVLYVQEQAAGLDDDWVLAAASADQRVVLTGD